jgi:phage terminase small subunit
LANMMHLLPKQSRFVEYYVQTWNAAEAARLAGYKPSRAKITGMELKKKPLIAEAIKVRMKDLQLETDDVLSRLAEQATANYSEFFTYKTGDDGRLEVDKINWEVFRSRGHLVKKLSWTNNGPTLELQDQQTALITVGKAIGALVDKHEVKNEFNQEQLNNLLMKIWGKSDDNPGPD